MFEKQSNLTLLGHPNGTVVLEQFIFTVSQRHGLWGKETAGPSVQTGGEMLICSSESGEEDKARRGGMK